MKKPKILFYDIETSPIIGYVWGLWENNLSLGQIKNDWHVLAFAAKWAGQPASKIMYMDQRKSKNIEDDKTLLKGIWNLLDEADVIIGQNSKQFDIKKLNARFILNGFPPPSSFKHIDTKQISSRKFAFTSNKLEYLTDKLCIKYKKLKHTKFSGFELWKQCLAGNPRAWAEMKRYNIYDVLSLEELYNKLQPWDNSLNLNLYHDNVTNLCSCGNNKFKKNGFAYTANGKFQRFFCLSCNTETRSKVNLFSKEKKQSLKVKV